MMMNDFRNVRRLPAEWETSSAVLLAWPHAATDWNYMLPEVQGCFREMVAAIAPWAKVVIAAPDIAAPREFLKGTRDDRIFYVTTDTDDTWARDFAPLTVELADGSFAACDFRFNGWGLKFAACHDNLVNRHLKASGLLTAPLFDCQDFVLEGGGIESDGRGTLMTTAHCQLSPNRNATLSRDEIERRLLYMFGADKLVWLDHGYLAGDDTDSHIDTLARFAPYDTIAYTGCDDPADEHYRELEAMERELKEACTAGGRGFSLVKLPLPDPIYDEDGQRLPATYANFLVLERVVVMPVYGQPRKDSLAARMVQVAYERPVVTVDCRALIKQHGSLHCMTMQMPEEILAI